MATLTLELTNKTTVAPLPAGAYLSLNFDARGDVLLSWLDESGALFVDCVGSMEAPVRFESLGFRFPKVQRFSDGRWLIVDGRCMDNQRNARIFSPALTSLQEFSLDDAIEQVVIDPKDNIWVGYFDENPIGLRKFSDAGELIYDFNTSSGYDIFDLYAMHLDLREDLWVYAYTDFYLARISNGAAEIVIEECPVEGARAILAGGTHVAFFGNYDHDDVFVFDCKSNTGQSIAFTVGGIPVKRPLIATRGETAALLWEDSVCFVALAELIRAIRG